jgi:hypothetical protein
LRKRGIRFIKSTGQVFVEGEGPQVGVDEYGRKLWGKDIEDKLLTETAEKLTNPEYRKFFENTVALGIVNDVSVYGTGALDVIVGRVHSQNYNRGARIPRRTTFPDEEDIFEAVGEEVEEDRAGQGEGEGEGSGTVPTGNVGGGSGGNNFEEEDDSIGGPRGDLSGYNSAARLLFSDDWKAGELVESLEKMRP